MDVLLQFAFNKARKYTKVKITKSVKEVSGEVWPTVRGTSCILEAF